MKIPRDIGGELIAAGFDVVHEPAIAAAVNETPCERCGSVRTWYYGLQKGSDDRALLTCLECGTVVEI